MCCLQPETEYTIRCYNIDSYSKFIDPHIKKRDYVLFFLDWNGKLTFLYLFFYMYFKLFKFVILYIYSHYLSLILVALGYVRIGDKNYCHNAPPQTIHEENFVAHQEHQCNSVKVQMHTGSKDTDHEWMIDSGDHCQGKFMKKKTFQAFVFYFFTFYLQQSPVTFFILKPKFLGGVF
jgi:hypothetical protein